MAVIKKEKILLSGHRGTRVHAVENTPAAFDFCIREGLDFIEFDVKKTRDNQLVVFHDERIDTLLNGYGRTESFSLEELREFRYSDGQIIETLEELFRQTRGKIRLMLEIKSSGISRSVVEAVHRSGFTRNEIIIQSFAAEDIAECFALDPEIPYGLCLGRLGKFPFFRTRIAERELRTRVGDLPVTWLNLDGPYIYNEFIAAARRRGLRIILGAKKPECYLDKLDLWHVEILNTDDGVFLRRELKKVRPSPSNGVS